MSEFKKTVTLKTRLSGKHFLWECVLFTWQQQNYYLINGFALSLALKQRLGATRQWRIVLLLPSANLNRGKFHHHLRDVFAPLVIRYIDLMESSIAQSLHKGFQKENWNPVRWVNLVTVNSRDLKIRRQQRQRERQKSNRFRACLHGGEGPQVGEVTRLGGVTRLSI